jgi:hypothetical protein
MPVKRNSRLDFGNSAHSALARLGPSSNFGGAGRIGTVSFGTVSIDRPRRRTELAGRMDSGWQVSYDFSGFRQECLVRQGTQ